MIVSSDPLTLSIAMTLALFTLYIMSKYEE